MKRYNQKVVVRFPTFSRTYAIYAYPLIEGMILRISPYNYNEVSPIVIVMSVDAKSNSSEADLLLFYQVAEVPEVTGVGSIHVGITGERQSDEATEYQIAATEVDG